MVINGHDGRCHVIPDHFGIHPVGDGTHVRIWDGGVTRLAPSQSIGDHLAIAFLKLSHALDPRRFAPSGPYSQ